MEGTASSSYFGTLNFEQVLDDLSSRFIVNLPAEELESIERICFQIEQAHWYYEDFVRPQASHLPSFSLRKFSEIIFKSNPLLSHFDAATAYDQFLRYKERVPVCGAILINSSWDKCLVVKGWKSGASWSFPRGKINQGEEERDCAVREVWEETGYDISPHFNPSVVPHESDSATCPPPLPPGKYPDDDFLECVMKEQRIRLYLVPNVSEDTLFETKTRKEISKIAWAPFTNLPTWTKKAKTQKKEIKCYMVTPFVNPLKEWIQTHRKQRSTARPETAKQANIYMPVPESKPEPSNQLNSQTQALQELFFGNATSPQLQVSLAQETNPLLLSSQPLHPTGAGSASLPSTSQQSRYIQNLHVLSPMPQSPGRTVDTLHRQIMRRGHESHNVNNASTSQNASSIAPDTLKAPSVYRQGFSSAGSPSYTDYRNSALSPSSFNTSSNNSMLASGSIYTEAEREAARNELLDQLVSQLGTPTPPSADEGTRDGTWEDETTSRQTPSGMELMALIQQQLQDVRQDGGSYPASAIQSIYDEPSPRLPSSNTPSHPHPSQNSTSQQILSILNGPSSYLGYASTSGNGRAPPADSKPGTLAVNSNLVTTTQNGQTKHTNPQMHASNLLSLFNGASKTPRRDSTVGGPAPTVPPGDASITRLFANIRM